MSFVNEASDPPNSSWKLFKLLFRALFLLLVNMFGFFYVGTSQRCSFFLFSSFFYNNMVHDTVFYILNKILPLKSTQTGKSPTFSVNWKNFLIDHLRCARCPHWPLKLCKTPSFFAVSGKANWSVWNSRCHLHFFHCRIQCRMAH